MNIDFRHIEKDLFGRCVIAARKAAHELRSWKDKRLSIDYKKDDSPVTIADRNSHEIIFKELEQTGIPILSEEGRDIPIEERRAWKEFWMIDPLDGTKEFIRGRNEYTINIALMRFNEPVFGLIAVPEFKVIYFGESGGKSYRMKEDNLDSIVHLPDQPEDETYRVLASRSHLSPRTELFIEQLRKEKGKLDFVQAGSALKFCKLAEGAAEIYPRFTPCMEWDTAAGHAILRGVGKEILKVDDGLPLEYNKPELLTPYFIAE